MTKVYKGSSDKHITFANLMKNDFFQIRISDDEKKELTEAAEFIDVPAAQIVREGMRQRVAEIKRKRVREERKDATSVA